MSLADKLLGRPLATEEKSKESLSVWTGVPAAGIGCFGLDRLRS